MGGGVTLLMLFMLGYVFGSYSKAFALSIGVLSIVFYISVEEHFKRQSNKRSLWFSGQIKECPLCESSEIIFENHFEGRCRHCSYVGNLEEFALSNIPVEIPQPTLWEQGLLFKGDPFWVTIPAKYDSLPDETLLYWMSKQIRARYLGSRTDQRGSREFRFSRISAEADERDIIESICKSIASIGK